MGQAKEDNLIKHIKSNLTKEQSDWFFDKLDTIIKEKSARDLFLTYSLCGSRLKNEPLNDSNFGDDLLSQYLKAHGITQVELGRVALIASVLNENPDFFTPKVQNLIQVADQIELATFLRYLFLLPNPKEFQMVAADALRTNITTVFDALSQNNPYPGSYFNDSQWNQMYLKAAFMQCDLAKISDVDKRANSDLARIISDYAHERWAASRQVDPYFWRPTAKFLEGQLLNDMSQLFESEDPIENKAAALCCHNSSNEDAIKLLEKYPGLKESVENSSLTWENLKN